MGVVTANAAKVDEVMTTTFPTDLLLDGRRSRHDEDGGDNGRGFNTGDPRKFSSSPSPSSHSSSSTLATNDHSTDRQHRLLHSSSSTSSETINLPWGDINIVVVTDVHSWIGRTSKPETTKFSKNYGRKKSMKAEVVEDETGQIDFQTLDVDYGDVVSFWRHLQDDVNQQHQHQQRLPRDIFFVMNGDFMDGTGLSTIPPAHLLPILQKMPWDALNVGNHELYFDETVRHIVQSGFIDHWNGTYLSSNTDLFLPSAPASTSWSSSRKKKKLKQKPLTGHRYTYLYGPNTNTTILTFGFLYNFDGHCPSTNVTHVEEVLEEDWFIDVLTCGRKSNHTTSRQRGRRRRESSPSSACRPYDAILVLAHMDCVHPLVFTIHNAIRKITDSMMVPILFITGHSHRRCYVDLDPYSSSFEAGHFLDTIGFASFNINVLKQVDEVTSPVNPSFQHRFIDATKQTLYDVTGHTNYDPTMFDTPEGLALSSFIQSTRQSLGLDDILGCSPQTYDLSGPIINDYQNKSMSPPSSIWWLWLKRVVPNQILRGNSSKIFIQGTMAFRYDLYAGPVTFDDVIAVCPFNDTVYEMVDNISGRHILSVLAKLQTSIIYTKWENLPPVGIATIGTDKDGYDIWSNDNTDPCILIDPDRSYALYMPDFDFHRVVNVVAEELGLSDLHPSKLEEFKRPKIACKDNDESTKKGNCTPIYTTDMWKNYILRRMPCTATSSSLRFSAAAAEAAAEMNVVPTSSSPSTTTISEIIPNRISWERCLASFVLVFSCTVIILKRWKKIHGRRCAVILRTSTAEIESRSSSYNEQINSDTSVTQNQYSDYGSI